MNTYDTHYMDRVVVTNGNEVCSVIVVAGMKNMNQGWMGVVKVHLDT